jgi:hypothetical protein
VGSEVTIITPFIDSEREITGNSYRFNVKGIGIEFREQGGEENIWV